MQNDDATLTTLVDRFAAGRLTRRDLVQALAGLVATAASTAKVEGWVEAREEAALATLGQPSPVAPTFAAAGLNHLALRVTDPDRSQAFYQRHLGLAPLGIGSGDPRVLAAGPHTLTLFKGERAVLDHFCFTVAGYDAREAEARVRTAGLTPEVEDDRVHFRDPDGYRVQVGGPTAGGQRP